MKKYYFLILFLFLFAGGCVKEIDFNPDVISPRQIVVNSLLTPDTVMIVHLSYTRPVTDITPHFIDNAEVEISDGDRTYPLQYLDSGIYINNVRPRAGQTYYLTVKVGDTVLTATTRIPRQPVIISALLYPGVYTDAEFYDYNRIDVVVKDWHPDQPDYYAFSVQDSMRSINNPNYIYYWWSSLYMIANEPYASWEGYKSIMYPVLYLSDEFLPKQEYDTFRLAATLRQGELRYNDTVFIFSNTNLVVRLISPEYYKYMKSVYAIKDYLRLVRDEFVFNNSFNLYPQPAELYTNIKNGVGIFGSFTQDFVYVDCVLVYPPKIADKSLMKKNQGR